MEQEFIQMLYEDFRNVLLNTSQIETSISEIKNPKLKRVLLEMFQTSQADLMLICELLYDINNSEIDSDMDLLLNRYQVNES